MSFTFKAKVAKVEERFEKVIVNPTAYGEAKTETKADEGTESRSIGWWVVLDGWGVAFGGGGAKKPDLAAGDVVTVSIAK